MASSDAAPCKWLAHQGAPRALIAWLSPRMAYSVTQWPAMHSAALRAGWKVQAVWDADVSREEIEAAMTAAPSALLPSADHRCPAPRPVLPHYPFIQVFTYGRLQAQPVLGVMPEAAWLTVLAARASSAPDTAAAPVPRTLSAAAESAQSPAARPFDTEPRTSPLKAETCIPANEYIALDTPTPLADLGSYERISPDGRFILRSFSGARITQVSLIELQPPNVAPRIRMHPTGLSNEAFPVQGTWRYIVDVNGEHYRFRDVLRLGAQAPVLFKGGMTGFYAAASEMTDSQGRIWLRSLSWPGADSGQSATDDAAGQLQARAIRIADDAITARIVQDTGPHYLCSHRRPIDGAVYALPMIATDGSEFSALPQTPPRGERASMRVFRLNRDPASRFHDCTQAADLRDAPSKAVFGFDAQSPVVYTDNGWVKWVDRNDPSLPSYALDEGQRDLLASAFPGVTRDGRIIFAATWKDCSADGCRPTAGYVIADPYQQSSYLSAMRARGQTPRACITQAQVRAQRQAFADFHGIAP